MKLTRASLLCFTSSLIILASLLAQELQADKSQEDLPKLVVQDSPRGEVNTVAFSTDGSLFASAGRDNTVKVWSTAVQQIVTTLTASPYSIQKIIFRPNVPTVISGSMDGVIRQWDGAKDWKYSMIGKHDGEILSLAFNSTGHLLASTGKDQTLRIWDIDSRKPIRSVKPRFGPPNAVCFFPSGETVAVTCGNSVDLFDIAHNTESALLTGTNKYIKALAISPNGHQIACGTENTIIIWEGGGPWIRREVVFRQRIINNPKSPFITIDGLGYPDDIHSLSFSQDGTRLAAASQMRIKVFDTKTLQELKDLPAHIKSSHSIDVNAVSFKPNSLILLSGSGDSTLSLWDAATGSKLWTMRAAGDGVKTVDFSSKGHMLAVGMLDGTLSIWSTDGAGCPKFLNNHSGTVWTLKFSPDGRRLAVGTRNKSVDIWDTKSGAVVRSVKLSNWPLAIAYSPNGQQLVTGDYDGNLTWWDARNGHKLSAHKYNTGINAIEFRNDGRYLAVAGGSTIGLVRVANRKLVKQLTAHNDPVTNVTFTSNGAQLASCSTDRTIRIWDVHDGRLIRTISESRRWPYPVGIPANSSVGMAAKLLNGFDVARVNFFPQGALSLKYVAAGSRLVSGGYDGAVKVWNPNSGQLVRTLNGHVRSVTTLAISPDGQYIVSGSEDGTVRLWRYNSQNSIATLAIYSLRGWAVISRDARFESDSIDSIDRLVWIMPDDPLTPLSPSIFLRQFYEPRLLPRLIADAQGNLSPDDAFDPMPGLLGLNRVQPIVSITSIKIDGLHTVAVTIKVENVRHEYQREKNKVMWSGCKDIRLFRDGQLVGAYPDTKEGGIVLEGGRVSIPKSRAFEYTFKQIQLPKQYSANKVTFTAYAFNTDNIKSETSPPYVFSLSSQH